MIGSIISSIVETRPDIPFVNSVASYFAKNSGHQHTKAVKTILQYLKGSKNQGIIYDGKDELYIEGYWDSDSAVDKQSRKSTPNFIFMLNEGAISWCSKKQPTVTLSFIEVK